MGGVRLSALEHVVAAASLAGVESSPLRSFTASMREGVLAQRRASPPWGFCVFALRAGLCLAPTIVARARVDERDGVHVLGIDIRADLDDWSWVDLAALLEESLRDAVDDQAPQRWRTLAGHAVNGALASSPRWLELHTPAGARRWARDEGASAGEDPYRVQRVATDVSEGGFALRMTHGKAGFADRIARWAGRDAPEAAVAKRWSEAIARPVENVRDGVVIERPDPAEAVSLGDAGRWWPSVDGGLYLRREGVRVAALHPAASKVVETPLHGEVDAPQLELDADGERVRVDEAFHELVAWMDAEANAVPAVPPPMLVDSRGVARATQSLSSADEIVFTWPHQPDSSAAVLTPPQLDWLRSNTGATFVPVGLVRTASRNPRVDLTALHEGSVGPVNLGGLHGCRVEAFVHRHPVASAGSAQAHGFGRVLFRTPAPALPGVTVVVTLPPETSHAARAESLAKAGYERAVSCMDSLTQAVLSSVADEGWRLRVPWIAHRWGGLSPQTLGLRYEPYGAGVRLTWNDEPLLAMTAGYERDGTPRSLRDALVRTRDVGGVVVSDAGTVWKTLESSAPVWTPWALSGPGESVLPRIIGESGLWRMPMVPEAQQRPQSVREQPHLRLTEARAQELKLELRGPGQAAVWARAALLAHALWARSTGQDSWGLDEVSLLPVYDPHAAHPWHWISVGEVATAAARGVVPPGGGHRGLAQPVLEASPAVAYALVELGLVPAAPVRAVMPEAKAEAAHAGATGRTVWMRHRVLHPHCVGALTLHDGPAGVELWAQGLRVQTLVLPPPYSVLSGRVWLQKPATAEVRRVLLDAAEAMRPAVRDALLLAAPGTVRARALAEFLEAMPEADAPAKPPRVAKTLGSDPLAATLRFALGRAVPVEVSRLSWSLVRGDDALERIRLGGRHALIRDAKDDATPSATAAAALAVLLELCRTGRLPRAAHDEAVTRVLMALE